VEIQIDRIIANNLRHCNNKPEIFVSWISGTLQPAPRDITEKSVDKCGNLTRHDPTQVLHLRWALIHTNLPNRPINSSDPGRIPARIRRKKGVQISRMDWEMKESNTRNMKERIKMSLLHNVQTGSGAHPASYTMGTGSAFPEGKAAEAWSSPPSSAEVNNGGAISELPHMSS
jgi:hypothetical protein